MRAVIDAIWGLVSGEPAFFAARFLVEPVAVGVQLGLDELFVDHDYLFFSAKFGCDLSGFFPGGTLHLEAFDVRGEISMVEQGMAKLVKQKGIKIRRIFDVTNGAWGAKRELFAGLKMNVWISIFERF